MGAPGTTPGPWAACGLFSGPVYIGAERPGNPARMDSVLCEGDCLVANAHQLAASPDLYDALEALERTVVELYREAFPGGNYGANALGSDGNKNTFADQNYAICAARATLAKARGEA